MTKMKTLTMEEMKNISAGAIVIESVDSYGLRKYQVWTDDKGQFYCSLDSRAEAERCANLYTSWEKYIAQSTEFGLNPNEIQF